MNRPLKTMTLGVLSAVALTSASISPVSAYSYRTCNGSPIVWSNGWTNMYLSTISFPPGSEWDTRLQNKMYEWNVLPQCRFNFYVGRDSDGTWNTSNGYNECVFYGIDGGSGTLAVTYSRWSGCFFSSSLQETDIAFDSAEAWFLGQPYETMGGISFQLVALHELGHSMGMLHEDRWLETMNSFYRNGGPIGYSRGVAPHADARASARFLYGESGSSIPDLAALNYKWVGSGSTGLISQPYSAPRGGTVYLDFTFENNGTASATFNIGFYLSTNDYISTGDRLLGTNTGAWCNAGFVGTYNRALTIPSNITPGYYYIGTLLDKNSQVSEWDESNNSLAATYVVYVY